MFLELLDEKLGDVMNFIPNICHPQRGVDCFYKYNHFSDSSNYTSVDRSDLFINLDMYIGTAQKRTDFHADAIQTFAWNLLLSGEKTWTWINPVYYYRFLDWMKRTKIIPIKNSRSENTGHFKISHNQISEFKNAIAGKILSNGFNLTETDPETSPIVLQSVQKPGEIFIVESYCFHMAEIKVKSIFVSTQ